MTADTPYPPAPPEEEAKDACCSRCSSLFHSTANHVEHVATFAMLGPVSEFPPGYDPAEADRLIGRDPSGPKPQ